MYSGGGSYSPSSGTSASKCWCRVLFTGMLDFELVTFHSLKLFQEEQLNVFKWPQPRTLHGNRGGRLNENTLLSRRSLVPSRASCHSLLPRVSSSARKAFVVLNLVDSFRYHDSVNTEVPGRSDLNLDSFAQSLNFVYWDLRSLFLVQLNYIDLYYVLWFFCFKHPKLW